MPKFELDGPYDIHRDGVPDTPPSPPSSPPPLPYAHVLIDLAEQREGLIVYLLGKVKSGDFHAVADAAMDIREIDAQLGVLKELRG